MIALALACAPALLIADEPTTGLDVTTQAAIMDLIRETWRAAADMATLLITHDLALAAEHCDRIVVMHAGHVVEVRPGRARCSKRRATRTPPSSSPPRRTRARSLADLAAIPGGLPDLRGDLPPCRYRARCERHAPTCATARLPRGWTC